MFALLLKFIRRFSDVCVSVESNEQVFSSLNRMASFSGHEYQSLSEDSSIASYSSQEDTVCGPPKRLKSTTHQKQKTSQSSDASDNKIRVSSRSREALWMAKFHELEEFKNRHGHCAVPTSYPENPNLGKWVKRQRYQAKLKQLGKPSSLSRSRKLALDAIGFVWNQQTAVWDERFEEVLEFQKKHGHASIPVHYPENKELGLWAKSRTNKQYPREHPMPVAAI